MLLRTGNATWFELLTSREELAPALNCLGSTGEVELQAHSDISATHLLPTLRQAIDDYRRLAQRYSNYWPAPSNAVLERHGEPEQLSGTALKQLHAWAVKADPLIGTLQQLAHERANDELWQQLLALPDAALPNLGLLARAGPWLASRAYLLAAKTAALSIPSAVLAQRIEGAEQSFVLAIGIGPQIAALDETLNELKARRLEIPTGLPAGREAARLAVRSRLGAIASQSQQLQVQLANLNEAYAIPEVLADLAFVEWLVDHVPELKSTEHFVWITGWTSDPSGARLGSALQRAQLHYLLRFPTPPREVVRPTLLRNPRWAQPFELFERLLGVPAANEADPSLLLAVLAPLLFGFMFGDVGQGAVLVVLGVTLRKRYPATAMLVPGGIAAMAFGVLFGSVFAREDILPALWVRPMQQPLALLGAGLACGSAIILLGLALDAVQCYWEGEAARWWHTRAGFVLSYLGIIGSPFDGRALWLLPLGLIWYCIGEGLQASPAAARGFGAAIAEALETMLQLFVNTLSFVRVGAFALAHAGLATVVAGLYGGINSRLLAFLVLALGNALLIVIEGLVVSIQTTRLVLFEFFIRFVHGSGRPFRPLQKPPGT